MESNEDVPTISDADVHSILARYLTTDLEKVEVKKLPS